MPTMPHADQDVTPEVMLKLLSGAITPEDIRRQRAAKAFAKRRGRRQNEIEADYAKLSTRNLLAIKNRSFWSDLPQNNDDEGDLRWYAIRKVLATREHVVRGSEAKRLRQQRAKAARGQGKGKNR